MTGAPGARNASVWREEAQTAAIAFGYFTRFPIPRSIVFTEARLARSGRYIPIVGAVVGALGALLFLIATHYFPLPVAVLLSMAATLLATGALHEDGLADCCDAFGGAYTRADVLRILKDSRIGVFGAIGLLVTLTLKWQTLIGLAAWSPAFAAVWMIVAHAASRAGAIVFTATLDYARATADLPGAPRQDARDAVDPRDARRTSDVPDAQDLRDVGASTAHGAAPGHAEQGAAPSGLAAKALPFGRNRDDERNGMRRDHAAAAVARRNAAIALTIGLPGLFWHGVWLGLILIVVGAVAHWLLGRWWSRRIGGYTGDCLGLAQQSFELGIYLLVLGWISS